jgi:hypothetical protein
LDTEVTLGRCCDRCNPNLFNETRPGKPIAASRTRAAKKGPPQDYIREALYKWRLTIKGELYRTAFWGPQAILDDVHCEMLASIGPVKTKEQLALLLENSWARWSVLGERLFAMMVSLETKEPEAVGTTSTTKRSLGTTLDPNEPNLPAAKRAKQSSMNAATSMSRKQQDALQAEFPPSSYDAFFSSFSRS